MCLADVPLKGLCLRLGDSFDLNLLADQLEQHPGFQVVVPGVQGPIPAAWRIRSRYSATPAMTMARRPAGENPRSRPMISILAARRLTSHSHGPGRVSSKSLMSKIICRSGVPNRPKLDRCASPHNCTVTPDTGVAARSEAMISAPPR